MDAAAAGESRGLTSASSEPVFDRALTDPLSAVTRVDRRWLLMANVVLAAMAYGGIVPSEINALGVKTAQINGGVIFVIAWATAGYLTVSFALYGSTDFKIWKMRMLGARQQYIDTMSAREAVVTEDDELSGTKVAEFSDLFDRRMRSFQRRAKFEFYFPLALSALNVPGAAIFYAFAR